MQRSRTQVIFRHLPGAVYHHDHGPIVRTAYVAGNRLTHAINKAVLLEEIERQLTAWPDDRIAGLVRPSRVSEREFTVIEPQEVYFEVWPLVMQCEGRCRRVRRYFNPEEMARDADVNGRLACRACGGAMRQLRYYACHQCGRAEPMFMPDCQTCPQGERYEHVEFIDTGSFETSYWRCLRHGYLRGTRITPCTCGDFLPPGAQRTQAFMRAFTTRDSRTYLPRTVTFLNPKSMTFDRFQVHPQRGWIALASYAGHVTDLQRGMEESAGAGGTLRMTQAEWEDAVRTRYNGLDAQELEAIRRARGPVTDGPWAIPQPGAAEASVATSRRVIERAAIFDNALVPRRTLADARRDAEGRRAALEAARLVHAEQVAHHFGIMEIAVTTAFPVALAAYGYSRVDGMPGQSRVIGFERRREDGTYQIFAIPTETEALLVTLSARQVLSWLRAEHGWGGIVPADEAAARLAIVRLFAVAGTEAQHVVTLVHSMAHALIHSLADGRSGFGESSLAEWQSPETLTLAVYVASFHTHTLGALWTVLHHRCADWLAGAQDGMWSCENDPLCHLGEPRACERCLYLTFGCEVFNQNLSRSGPISFWRHTGHDGG